jgi:formamidopyrimidine-DNA glycosylase
VIEIPEAISLARQLEERLEGKRIESVVAGTSPHKFAWYYGDRDGYGELAAGKTFRSARAVGGMVEGAAGSVRFLWSEGASLRFLPPGALRPPKHQFLMTFADGSSLVASIQMYGGIGVFEKGWSGNPYYRVSLEKPSPLTDAFDETYFGGLFDVAGIEKLSVKALLATEQRVPGLGNGVLQDILFRARINPRTKTAELDKARRRALFRAVKRVLREMADRGGRDTETDLDGNPGGYTTVMSRNTTGKPCPACGTTVLKEAYLGGSVYWCPGCQPLSSPARLPQH